MKKLNYWELVKLTKRQRRDIKPKRERGENRKNSLDGISLNPKCSHNRKSAAKPRNRKAQRLFLLREVHTSMWKWFRLNK